MAELLAKGAAAARLLSLENEIMSAVANMRPEDGIRTPVFFNLGDSLSQAFFDWIITGNEFNPAALVARAEEMAKADAEADPRELESWVRTLGTEPAALEQMTQEKLADILIGMAHDLANEPTGGGSENSEGGSGDAARPSGALGPVMAGALDDINYLAVAEALLMRAGKWAVIVGD